jgi:surfactin synthase thioesterase subunit
MNDPWLYKPLARPDASVRLFCFTHAGVAAAFYRLWPQGLPADVEVCAIQLPGRGSRFREPPFTRMHDIVRSLASALRAHVDRPFAFFGHSMGAIVAREVARELSRAGLVPGHLFVSGRRPPWMPDPDRRRALHPLPDAEFVDEVSRRYGGIPPEVRAHDDLMALLLPGLRADFEALETFALAVPESLPCPVTAYGGTCDPQTPRTHLDAWCTETRSDFSVRTFEGGHFYLEPQRADLLSDISARLGRMCCDTGRETVA